MALESLVEMDTSRVDSLGGGGRGAADGLSRGEVASAAGVDEREGQTEMRWTCS